MHYNPEFFRWEGNENALVPFEADRPTPASSSSISTGIQAIVGSAGPESSLKTEVNIHPGGGSISGSNHNHQPAPVQRPALITNFGTTSPSVQVVGGMVFDPRKMCWLKLSQYPNHGRASASNQQQPLSPSVTSSAAAAMACVDDDEEDPFAGIADLVEKPISSGVVGGRLGSGAAAGFVSGPGHDAASSSTSPAIGGTGSTATGMVGRPRAATASGQDEWLVGEEFDVGREWVRRQRDDEVRWTRRFGDWGDSARTDEWKWAIQKVALSTIIAPGLLS